jgi:hypothetical protein
MDRAVNNTIFAFWLNGEVKKILERDASNRAWNLIDKTKLPPQCFLWIENKTNRRKWYLPYREGTGGINPETKMYRKAGLVNLNALKAIDEAMGGKTSTMPSIIPREIRTKIIKLLKEFSIGKYAEDIKEGNNIMNKIINIQESSISKQFAAIALDKKERLISGVVLLRPTSSNSYFKGSTGTRFTENFLKSVAENINNKKWYKNHASPEEMKKHQGVRSVDDLLGYYENGRMVQGIPKADIKYLSAQAPFVESWVEEMADKIGLSIVANGAMTYDRETGIAEATDLKSLLSADLVTETGSTVNMFESESKNKEEESMDYKVITMKELLEHRPDLVEGMKKGILDEVSTQEEVDSFKTQISELTETNKVQKKKLDDQEIKDKISEKKDQVDTLLKESKLDEKYVTKTFKESLVDAKDEEAIKALITDRKELVEGQKKKPGGKIKDMGDGADIGKDTLSDEDFEKAVVEAAESRG